MKEFWDQRYADKSYVYGTEPNQYFKDKISGLAPGRILLPGEGEGRNAVFAAHLGWAVDAYDYSTVAREKALLLAKKQEVEIQYDVADIAEYKLPVGVYDLVALIFVHLHTSLRPDFHKSVIKTLKPGGILIAAFFSTEQLEYNTGGPKVPEMLYDIDDLSTDLVGINVMEISREIVSLDEGPFHAGKASVIQMVGMKRQAGNF